MKLKKYKEKERRKSKGILTFLLLGILLLIQFSLVNSLTLHPTTIINSTVSNSSVVIGAFNINVQRLLVQPSSIEMNNLSWYSSTVYYNMSIFVYDTINSEFNTNNFPTTLIVNSSLIRITSPVADFYINVSIPASCSGLVNLTYNSHSGTDVRTYNTSQFNCTGSYINLESLLAETGTNNDIRFFYAPYVFEGLNILNVRYLISELIGGMLIAGILLIGLIVFICYKIKLSFAVTSVILVFALGTIGIIAFSGVFIILAIVVGIVAGIIYYTVINKG